MDIQRGRGYVYRIEYHLVWCVKYRRLVLQGGADESLKAILHDIAAQNGLEVVSLEVMPDHVHILLGASPQQFIPDFVKALKGASARRMFTMHPEIKKSLWGGNLWNPSYFIATVSENTREQIRRYIEEQHDTAAKSI